jgi:hypothetical protein
MNAGPEARGARKASSEQAFFENQKLPPDKRGVTFEALFYKQLHNVTARIHDTENLEQIMLEASQDICKLLNADRLTLYAVNDDRTRSSPRSRPASTAAAT